MNFVKATASSIFHNSLYRDFRLPAEPGNYYRYCPEACDGNNGECACCWPVVKTRWDVTPGWTLTATWDRFGKNNILLHLERVQK